ncbi:methionine biosynthesis PLP-dependent protein [Falsibacillus albus]|uniref:Methionine biosynthesis PLP-dependent protein n=1 Tax=Falsibacillus albus TaxID=2478915 RepID=A0A3L7JTK8_9BACI|nr:methionine biosynthesis PLP-dependent protein [Falsibacillus albus]RLQ93840.1 methionine biosynthesis PLP-dependent protein [Falsibacillus albus]
MAKHIQTLLAQAGNHSDAATGAVSAPLHFSTAYQHNGLGQSTGFDYTRTGNPTRSVLEKTLAQLEGGHSAFAFASGMAAIQAVLSLFSTGDELIVSYDLYGGSYRLFAAYEQQYKLKFHYVDTTCPEAISEKINAQTKALFIETPTNPLMNETSIVSVAQLANEQDLLLIVDNTFYTPLLQRPIEEGADLVIHSATKYLGGHNDVLAGVVVAKEQELGEKIGSYQNGAGAVLSPFDCWLVLRGLKTLHVRMRAHEENAGKVSAFLSEHECVTDVIYPGKGGMLSFRLAREEWVAPFLEKIRVIKFAESLGGVESFITYPATQTHADIPEEIRVENGVCGRLLRFSVGIEHIDDIIGDLEKVLTKLKREAIVHE